MDGPLHRQIADSLRRQIATGELPVGAPVPSEAELQSQWHGSRSPVRQALATLRSEGLIAGGQGKSPVVQRRQVGQPLDTLLSFTRWAGELGRTPGQRALEIALRPAPAEIAAALEIEAGEPVVQLMRLRLLDGEPAMLERTTFTAQHGRPLFDFDLDSGSIYGYLVGLGLAVGVARHTIDAIAADATDATLLEVDLGTPLLRERRTARTVDGAPFEYSDDRYRADLVAFTIDNQPAAHSTIEKSQLP